MSKNNQGKAAVAAIAAALVLSAGLVIGLAALAGEPAPAPAKKSLTRGEDPVVILPAALKPMEGKKIAELAVFAFNDGQFVPIPFQVDERGGDGLFVYTAGPQGKGGGDSQYNGKDELVFMAWDTGDQAPGKDFPCQPKDSAEVAVSDGAGTGWVYVVECHDKPPRSAVDYVRQEADATHDWVRTDRYAFAEPKGQSYFDRLCLRGPSGKVGPNLVDRLKGRGNLTAAGGMVKLHPNEADAKGSLLAYIDGPVRVVHHMKAYVQFSVVKLNIGGESENLFYPNFFVTPITFGTPVAPSSLLSSISFRYSIDFLGNMNGSRYYDPVNNKGVTLDGKMSPEEKALNLTASHDWWGLNSSQGNFMVRMVLPAEWRKVVPMTTYYVDDPTPDPPESDPGQRCPGLQIDLMKMTAGTYKFKLYYMVPPGAMPGAAPTMNAIIDRPLKVTAKKLD